MASGMQKRVKLPRKVRILSNVAKSRAVKGRSIILNTILRICKLKLKLEAIKRAYHHLLKNTQEVKVEKFGERFLVNITCKKGQNVLVSILETFEEMNVNVAQAKVSCIGCFLCIEAILEGQGLAGIDAQCIQQAVHKTIDKQVG